MSNQKHIIVLVDDDKDILATYADWLSPKYNMVLYSSGPELLAELEYLNPSLIILDWLMPSMDGLTLCKKIRQFRRLDPVPIAFLTGVTPSLENIEAATKAGAQSFISKLVDMGFILIQIQTLVDNFARVTRYFKDRELILSVLKHDISNLLTGVTTGVEVLMMNPLFADANLDTNSGTILSAAQQLRELFLDLSELLSLYPGKHPKETKTKNLEDILNDVQNYLSFLPRRVEIATLCLPLACRRREMARAIYYLIRLVDKHLPAKIPIQLKPQLKKKEIQLWVRVKGTFKKEWEQIFLEAQHQISPSDNHDLLFIKYIRGVLRQYQAQITIAERDRTTEVGIIIPYSSNIAEQGNEG